MSHNPYAPPESPMEEKAGRPLRHTGLRIYLVVLTGLVILGYGTEDASWMQPLDFVDLVAGCVGLTGAFCYAFHTAFGSRSFWRQWFFVQIAWDALYQLLLTPLGIAGQVDDPALDLVELAIVLVILVPLYVALFRYGYRCDDLWPAAER